MRNMRGRYMPGSIFTMALLIIEKYIRIDEALFLGGMPKKEFLKAFGADIFFDDQKGHCEDAAGHISTAHVPHGVTNQLNKWAN